MFGLFRDRKIQAVLVVGVLILASGLFVMFSGPAHPPGPEKPSNWWARALVNGVRPNVQFSNATDGSYFLIDSGQGMDGELLTAAATPAVVRWNASGTSEAGTTGSVSGAWYTPLLLDNGGVCSPLEQFTSLTDRNELRLDSGKAEKTTANLALLAWKKAPAVMLFSDYEGALQAAPLASYIGMPMVFVNNSVGGDAQKVLDKLGTKYAICIGKAPVPTIRSMELPKSQINDFYLDVLSLAGEKTDYLVMANPNDTVQRDWGKEGSLPVYALSSLAPELAAYHKGMVIFGDGLTDLDHASGGNLTQLGPGVDVVNNISSANRDRIIAAVNLEKTKGFDVKYLAIVGDPVNLPFYYAPIPENPDIDSFTPSDYYFANIDDTPEQELAEGRIMGTSLPDASCLLARTLAFSEVIGYNYASSSRGQLLSDWKKNALDMTGPTIPTPFPGCLVPMLYDEYRVLSQAGFTVVPVGMNTGNANALTGIMDDFNYASYFGHGNYDLWYSNKHNYITSKDVISMDLKPGAAVAMACLTGMTDNATLSLSDFISMAFLYAGFNTYIGATRSAEGLYDKGGALKILQENGALFVVDATTRGILAGMDAGSALMKAKNDMLAKWGAGDSLVQLTINEYVLYGDPAHRPYVP